MNWIAAERAKTAMRHAVASMSERDGKDQREGSPKQARSCWSPRHCWLVLLVALRPPYCISLTDVVFYPRWISRLFIHVCSSEKNAFRPPITVLLSNCVVLLCFCFFLLHFLFAFSEYILYGYRVATTTAVFLSFRMGFYFVTTGWISEIGLLWENSIRSNLETWKVVFLEFFQFWTHRPLWF